MTITTTTQIDAAVNFVAMGRFLAVAEPTLAYFIGAYDGEAMISPHSNTFAAKWRRFEKMTVSTTALTALSGTETYPFRAGTAMSKTDVNATLAKYGNVISYNEEVDLTNPTTMLAQFVDRLAQNGGETFNRLQRNVIEDNLTLVRASGATSDGNVADVLTAGLLDNVTNTLERNSAKKFTAMTTGSQNIGTAPILPSFWALGHVDLDPDIRAIPGFRSVETYAGQTQIMPNEIGYARKCRFILTEEASIDTDSGAAGNSNVRSTSGTDADLYTLCVLGKEYHGALGLGREHLRKVYMSGDRIPAMELIVKGRGSSGAMDPLNEIGTMGWKGWHAGVELNDAWGRGIRVAASKLS